MKLIPTQINPTSRIATALHALYLVLLPLLMLGLVRSGFSSVAVLVVFLSKWRMFAVKPRYWLANIRANAVDMIIGVSTAIFLINTTSLTSSLVWAGLYACWLVLVKPRSSAAMIGTQALLAQGVGLVALFNNYSDWNQTLLATLTWVVCFCAARHFLNIFEDDYARVTSHLWGAFGAEMSLIMGHWHVVYASVIPQVALILSLIGYSLATGFYFHKVHTLGVKVRNQLVGFCVVILVLMILLGNWQPTSF